MTKLNAMKVRTQTRLTTHMDMQKNFDGSQVNNYGPVPAGKHRKSLERGSSIPAGKFSDFSDDFRPVPAGKHGKLTGIYWKKSEKFSVGILLPFPAISVAFLQDPAGSSGRNFRHGLW